MPLRPVQTGCTHCLCIWSMDAPSQGILNSHMLLNEYIIINIIIIITIISDGGGGGSGGGSSNLNLACELLSCFRI